MQNAPVQAHAGVPSSTMKGSLRSGLPKVVENAAPPGDVARVVPQQKTASGSATGTTSQQRSSSPVAPKIVPSSPGPRTQPIGTPTPSTLYAPPPSHHRTETLTTSGTGQNVTGIYPFRILCVFVICGSVAVAGRA